MARRWITGEGGEGYWEEEKTKKKVASKVQQKVDPEKNPATWDLINRPERPVSTVGRGDQGPALQNGANMGAAQPGNGNNLAVQAPTHLGFQDSALISPSTMGATVTKWEPPATVTKPPATVTKPPATAPTTDKQETKIKTDDERTI